MTHQKRVAPLQLREKSNFNEEDREGFNALNSVFGNESKDTKQDNATLADKSNLYINLDDWSHASLDDFVFNSTNEGNVVHNVEASLKYRTRKTGSVDEPSSATHSVELLPRIQNKPLLTSVRSVARESNTPQRKGSEKHMFTSREYDEDSTLRLRFAKRDIPALKIKELSSLSRYHPLPSALRCTDKEWFTAGVVVNYRALRSSSGSLVDITDLAETPYELRVLLFNDAHTSFIGKLVPGAIICVKNPKKGRPFNGKEALTVNIKDQILLAGKSRDYGVCGARKKSGGLCSMVVNTNICRLCSYHALSEYKNKNMQSDIRAAALGTDLRSHSNKTRSTKKCSTSKLNYDKANKDQAILQKLAVHSNASKDVKEEKNSLTSGNNHISAPGKRKFDHLHASSSSAITPVFSKAVISPSTPMSAAKKRAIEFAQKTGGFSQDVSKNKIVREQPSEMKSDGNVITPEFLQLMNAKPNNPALLAEVEGKARDERFDKLQVIEEVGEKLSKMHEIPVRLVRCLVCKKNYNKLPLECTQRGHKCRIVKGTRKFFECTNCHCRTSTIERLPTTECTKCGHGNWKRAGVAPDKVCRNLHQLSVRGIEEKFLGSIVTDPNLSLLVPDEHVS